MPDTGDTKVSDLTAATSLDTGDLIYAVVQPYDTGSSRSVQFGNVISSLPGAGQQDTGYFLSDTGFALSDTGQFLSDSGAFLSDSIITTLGRNLIDDTGQTTMRTTLGLGSSATQDTGYFVSNTSEKSYQEVLNYITNPDFSDWREAWRVSVSTSQVSAGTKFYAQAGAGTATVAACDGTMTYTSATTAPTVGEILTDGSSNTAEVQYVEGSTPTGTVFIKLISGVISGACTGDDSSSNPTVSGTLVPLTDTGADTETALLATGAASVTTLILGAQFISAQNARALFNGGNVFYSVDIKNETGANFTPNFTIRTFDVRNDSTAKTTRVNTSTGVTTAVDGAVTTVSASIDPSTVTDWKNGFMIYFRVPSGSLDATTKYVAFSQAKLCNAATLPEWSDVGTKWQDPYLYLRSTYRHDIPVGRADSKDSNAGGGSIQARAPGKLTVINGLDWHWSTLMAGQPGFTIYSPVTGTAGQMRHLDAGRDDSGQAFDQSASGCNIKLITADSGEVNFAAHCVAKFDW